MPEIVLFGFGTFYVRFGLFSGSTGIFKFGITVFDFFKQGGIAAISVQHAAVRCRIEQSLVIKLPVDFDQATADFTQQFDADRLVVNENLAFALSI